MTFGTATETLLGTDPFFTFIPGAGQTKFSVGYDDKLFASRDDIPGGKFWRTSDSGRFVFGWRTGLVTAALDLQTWTPLGLDTKGALGTGNDASFLRSGGGTTIPV